MNQFTRGQTVVTTKDFSDTIYTCIIICTDVIRPNRFVDETGKIIPTYKVLIIEHYDMDTTLPYEHHWINERCMELVCSNQKRGEKIIEEYNVIRPTPCRL